jgi:drug/metabolite transporter (DMT)-like permease
LANAPLRLGAVEWGLIVLQSMLWGSSYFFIAVARPELPAFTIAFLRLLPAVALLLVILLPLGYRLPATWAEWRMFVLFSVINSTLPFVLVVWGQSQFSGGMAAVFNATAPLFGVFLAHLLTHDEKLSFNKVAGILVGICGVAVLAGTDLAEASGASILARVALIGAPLCYVLANIYVRTRLGSYHPFVIAVMQAAGGIPSALLLMLLVDQPWTLPMPSLVALGAVVGMGTLGMGLASLCHYTVLRRAGTTNALVVTLIMPLTPILLGVFFLGDRLSGRDMAGALVIAAALLLIDGRIVRALRRAPPPA